ncbi:induced myeloid leukemia cell differentiation protein Mcl-1 homolog [Narcine bancroftii]|uniref:induced myeloid leukemia cell differentiation protein Mcl-1 homolog n=1 Tax=Narcine bancroftii TaxID=1343680 RepID=UPI003832023C
MNRAEPSPAQPIGGGSRPRAVHWSDPHPRHVIRLRVSSTVGRTSAEDAILEPSTREMEQSVMTLNRGPSSAKLQLTDQFFCSGSTWVSRNGSLPQTPDDGEAADSDAFSHLTFSLVRGFLRQYVGLAEPAGRTGWLCWSQQPGSGHRQAAETLQRIGARLIEKHRTAFTGMVNRLNNSHSCSVDAISRVAAEMFSDGEMNWGRVVSFIVFGAVLSDHLKKTGPEDCIDDVATRITQYLTKELREWLESHNGWDGFTKFFQENSSEECAKKALMWIAGVGIAGVGIIHLLR